MTSNSKMVLFFIGATVFNILLMFAFILVFFIIIVKVLGDSLNGTLGMILIFVGFIASIVLTFLVYGKAMKWVTVKWQLEKNIPQLFKGKKKPK